MVFRRSIQRRIERVGRSKLIQTKLTEPDVEFFTKFGSSHEKFDVWPRPLIFIQVCMTYTGALTVHSIPPEG